MSFNPELREMFISNLPVESWEVIDWGEPMQNAGTWDTVTVRLAGIWPDVPDPSELLASEQWIGYKVPIFGDWWAQSARASCVGGAVYQMTLDCKGIAGSPGTVKTRISNGTEQQSARNVEVTGVGLFKNLRTLIPVMEFERVYLQNGGLDLSVIGTNVTPPGAPTPPDNPWITLPDDSEARWPFGWTLTSREPEYLAGVTTDVPMLVRDLFSYIFPRAPG